MSKTIFISDKFPPHFGGMESHAYEFIRYFSKNNKWPLSKAITFRPEDVPGPLPTKQIINSELIDKYLNRVLTFNSTEEPHELINVLKKEDIRSGDIIFFNSMWWIRIFDDVKGEFPDTKLYFRSGGNDILQSNIIGKGDTLDKRRKYVVDKINNSIDTLIVNSDYSLNAFRELGINDEIMLKLTGGVDVQRFKPSIEKEYIKKEFGLHDNTTLIVGVGRLIPCKGFDIAIEALAELKHPFKYIIVGDGPHHDIIQKTIERNHLENKVQIYGSVDFTKVHQLYQIADIYLQFPIKWIVEVEGGSYNHAESMGRSFIEAAACGLPCIGTNVGGVPEVVDHGKTGYLADENDSGKIIEYLNILIEDKNLRTDIGNNARLKAVSHFSWDVLFESYIKDYEK